MVISRSFTRWRGRDESKEGGRGKQLEENPEKEMKARKLPSADKERGLERPGLQLGNEKKASEKKKKKKKKGGEVAVFTFFFFLFFFGGGGWQFSSSSFFSFLGGGSGARRRRRT